MPFFSKIKAFVQRNIKFKLDKRVFIFLFFFCCAWVIWLMNRLSQDYSSVFSYSLAVKNENMDGLVLNQSENELFIRGKASGFYIMQSKLSKSDTLYVDLRDKKAVRVSGEKDIYGFSTNAIRDKVADALQGKVIIENVWPDTVFFNSSKFSTKKVPVVPAYHLSFNQQYRQIGATHLVPDSVVIKGSQAILDTINAVNTYTIRHEDIQGNQSGNIELIPVEGVSYSNLKIHYSITAKRITEGKYKLPVNVINASDKNTVFLFPTEVEVNFMVPLDTFTFIKPDDFTLIVDVKQAPSAISRKLKVELQKIPNNIYNVTITPPYVEFVIHENNN